MRDEELWHSEDDRLDKDQRDDRRDKVTGDVGSLGFVGFDEDEDRPRQPEEAEDRDPSIGNEVENFTDEYAQNEKKLQEKTEGETVEEPMPEDGPFRDNRATAGQTILEEGHPLPPQDQVTPPDDEDEATRDGAEMKVKPKSERNEPDRD